MTDSSDMEVVRCGKLLVALKKDNQSKQVDLSNPKWKWRFVTLKADAQGALLEVHKIRSKGDDVFSFQIELRQGTCYHIQKDNVPALNTDILTYLLILSYETHSPEKYFL